VALLALSCKSALLCFEKGAWVSLFSKEEKNALLVLQRCIEKADLQ
jgi:hypothetical protein